MILNEAKRNIALLLAGSYAIPNYFTIGSGSGTLLNSQTSLFYPLDIQIFTSADSGTKYQITYTGDWTSLEMSGLNLSEFGLNAISGTGFTGSMWTKTVIPNIAFTGNTELRISETVIVF